MATTCKANIIIPPLAADFCEGNKKDVRCVLDTQVYLGLGLEANSSQQEFNQAIYSAFMNLKSRVDAIQLITDNL